MKTLIAILISMILSISVSFADVSVSITDSKVLESKDLNIKLKLPFDTEYKIKLVNNDNGKRALVKIRIDGRNVTGKGLILRTGETVYLERFLDSGTLSKGKKFKFIPKDEENLRPDNPEDGQIIVMVQYEKSTKPVVKYQEERQSSGYREWSYYGSTDTTASSNIAFYNTNLTSVTSSEGITVEGSESIQRFQKENVGELEDKTDTLIIELKGFYKEAPLLLNQ